VSPTDPFGDELVEQLKGIKGIMTQEKYTSIKSAENHVESLMYGFMASSVLFVGEELGVFDIFAKSCSVTLQEAAMLTNISENQIERLMIAACSIGLIQRHDQHTFSMPENMKPLFLKNGSHYYGTNFKHYSSQTAPLFQFLPEALKEGKNQWHRLASKEEDNATPFADVYSSEEKTQVFLDSMWGLGYQCSKELVEQFDMFRFSKLIDLGGASGSFLIAAAEKYTNLSGSVFDLQVVEPHFERKRKEHDLVDRLSFCAGDLFQDSFPEADLYSLGYILSDWSTEKGNQILQKIYDHLPTGGAVIILEKLFNDKKDGPVNTAMMNLVMLLEMEGQHHTTNEYFQRLDGVGFSDMKCYRSNGEKHMIVGFKP
jgi:hypothetical protein